MLRPRSQPRSDGADGLRTFGSFVRHSRFSDTVFHSRRLKRVMRIRQTWPWFALEQRGGLLLRLSDGIHRTFPMWQSRIGIAPRRGRSWPASSTFRTLHGRWLHLEVSKITSRDATVLVWDW